MTGFDSTYKIRVIKHYLHDHSAVFNVRLGDIEFAAVTEKDARKLAEKLHAAIDEHTVDTVELAWGD